MRLMTPSATRAPEAAIIDSMEGRGSIIADSLADVPPLRRTERIALLVLVAVGVGTGVVVVLLEGTESPVRSVAEILLTLLFALFTVSPAVAVTALALVVAGLFGLQTPLPGVVALAVATGFVARTASARLLAIFIGVLLVAAAGAIGFLGPDQTGGIVVALLLATLSGSVGLLLRGARGRERSLERQLHRRMRIEREIRDSERLAIADELHDVVSHDLTVIVMQTELRELEHGALDPAQLTIREAAKKALSDLRRIVETSPASAPFTMTLAEAVSDAQTALTAAGCSVTARVDTDVANLPRIVDTTLARVVRESATNVLKHVGPTTVEISLVRDGARVKLCVENTLPDRQRRATPPGGYGGVRISERVTAIGGSYHAGLVGTRWRVTATVPTSPSPLELGASS